MRDEYLRHPSESWDFPMPATNLPHVTPAFAGMTSGLSLR
jgi:hypothetical protein